MHVLLNEKILDKEKASISPDDRGFLLGDGIFETIRSNQGRMAFFDQHYQRLKKSADFLKIPFNLNMGKLFNFCKQLLEVNGLAKRSASLRITLTRGLGNRGIAIPTQLSPTLLITTANYEPSSTPIRVCITSVRRNEYSEFTQLKTIQYLDSIMARLLAKEKGFDEGLMLNTQGKITETSVANIFFIIDGCLVTPRLEDGVMPGIVRAFILQICEENNIPFKVISIYPDDVLSATEAFQTNSLIGVQPIIALNDSELDVGGNGLTQFLMKCFDSLHGHC